MLILKSINIFSSTWNIDDMLSFISILKWSFLYGYFQITLCCVPWVKTQWRWNRRKKLCFHRTLLIRYSHLDHLMLTFIASLSLVLESKYTRCLIFMVISGQSGLLTVKSTAYMRQKMKRLLRWMWTCQDSLIWLYHHCIQAHLRCPHNACIYY